MIKEVFMKKLGLILFLIVSFIPVLITMIVIFIIAHIMPKQHKVQESFYETKKRIFLKTGILLDN